MEIVPWMIVLVSSIWVLIDAKSIGVRKGQLTGISNMEPWGWFFVSLLLWIIGFPLYLARRSRYKQINGKGGDSSVATAIGLVLVAVQAALIVMMFTGDIKMPTSDLQQEIRKSIEETLGEEPAFASAKIQSFGLIHKIGNQYEGILEINADGVTKRLVVDVTYDGKQFMWRIKE